MCSEWFLSFFFFFFFCARSCLDEDAIVALVNEGDRAKTFVVMGQCYAELNEDRLAIAAFESAMELDPYVQRICPAAVLPLSGLNNIFCNAPNVTQVRGPSLSKSLCMLRQRWAH